MLEKILIENFQPHENTIVNFHKGLNVFVGPTDSGKSAFRRALTWCTHNEPRGDDFRSHWGGITKVEITADGKTVVRTKDKKDLYQFNDIDYKSFGTKVPDEIANFFNLTDVNIQEQINSFFLLTDTPGYVASYLNNIANIGQIDSVTKAIKSDLNQTKRLITHKEIDLEQKQIEVNSYAFLSEMETAIMEVTHLTNKRTERQLEFDSITYLIQQAKSVDAKIEENSKILIIKADVDSVLSDIAQKKKLEKKLNKLSELLARLTIVEDEIVKLSNISDLQPLLISVFSNKTERSILSTKLVTLNNLIEKYTNIESKLKLAQEEYVTNKNLYDSKLKEMGKCFICGSKLK